MYKRLKKLYLAGRLNDTGLENAVTRGWITEDQKAEIIEANAIAEIDKVYQKCMEKNSFL